MTFDLFNLFIFIHAFWSLIFRNCDILGSGRENLLKLKFSVLKLKFICLERLSLTHLLIFQKHLGLVESSLTGSKVDSHIFCNFTRLRVIRKPDPESSKVKDLTSPYYILFATGPTDGNGEVQIFQFF